MEANWNTGYKNGPRSFITVLDRMIGADLLKTLVSVWAVIVVIIVSRKFIKVLDQAIDGQISSNTLLFILGLKTIVASIDFLPAATFMAVLMVLGRMYRDQEMSAISSAGGGSWVLYRAVFCVVMPLSILSFGLTLYVAPWAEATIAELIHTDEQSADIRGIGAGKFTEYSQGDLVFYVEKVTPDNQMHKVFVQNRQHHELAIINAETAHFQDMPDGRYLFFEKGERVQGQPGTLNYVIEQFAEYAVRIEEKATALLLDRRAMTTYKLAHSKVIWQIAELQRRMTMPFSLALLAFLAVPLAQISPRGGVYGNIMTGFLIYFCYGNFSSLSQGWVMNKTIPVWLGAVGVNFTLLVVGFVLLARWYGFKWLLLKAKRTV